MAWSRLGILVGTFAICLVVSVGDGPGRMPWPVAVVASLAAAAAVWVSRRRPILALLVAAGTCVVLPATNSSMAGLQLVVALLVYRAVSVRSGPVWPVAALGLVALTVNVVWTRNLGGQPLADAATLQPLLLCVLALGLAVQARALAAQRDAVLAADELRRRAARTRPHDPASARRAPDLGAGAGRATR